jgi:hypothetical protein
MHRPTFSRTQRGPCTRSRSTAWARTLENWLTWYRTSGHGTCRRSRLGGWRNGPGRRFVYRTRSGLGDDHARRRRMHNWSCWFRCHWTWRLWRRDRSGRNRCWRRGLQYRWRRGRRIHRARRNRRHRGCGSRCRRLCNGRRGNRKCRTNRRCRDDNPRRRNRHGRGHRGRGRRGNGCWSGRSDWARGKRNSHAHRSLLFTNGIQNIARSRDIREIDLGLNLIAINAAGPRLLGRSLRLAGSAQVSADLHGFVLFHRTGVRLLLSDADFRKCVENGFAFDFQLPGQIVNSNLAHPPFLSSGLPR